MCTMKSPKAARAERGRAEAYFLTNGWGGVVLVKANGGGREDKTISSLVVAERSKISMQQSSTSGFLF